MSEPDEQPVERRGRKTKEEEARAYLESMGVDVDEVLASAGVEDDAPMPDTFAEFRDEMMRILWKKRHTLGDTALSQNLRALAQLASATKEGGGATAAEPLVADVIAGIGGLSDERRREILAEALVGLDAERARIVEVLGA